MLAAELPSASVKIFLPVVPPFELPAMPPGRHSVKELRVRGAALLETEVVVEGYVTWIYDCVAAVQARTGVTAARARRDIEKDPTLCRRPAFYIGDAPGAPPEQSIWVVEVPRRPTKLERKHLPKEELEQWPAVPTIAIGDHVLVRGTWLRRSPHGEMNSDGLLLYASVEPYREAP